MRTLLILLLTNIITAVLVFHLIKPKPLDPIINEIRDSIYIIHDSIEKEIIYINKEYVKKTDTILNADDSLLYSKFSEYIQGYKRSVTNN